MIPFVGVGTGRCGSNSLTRIVGACENTLVSHEAFLIHWYRGGENLGKMIAEMRDYQARGVLRGCVAMYYIPWIAELRSAIPGLKVVALHRPKEETVESFLNFGSYMIRPRDKKKWADGSSGRRAEAITGFPLIDAASVRQSYEFYWEMYETLMEDVKPPVHHMWTDDFNHDDKIEQLFDFLEIPAKDRRIPEKRKYYDRKEIDGIRRRLTQASSLR